MSKVINTNRELQGNLSIEKRQDLMFSHVQTYSQKRTLLGSHFVKMPMVGYYFRINPDNTIDWQNPISSGDLILDLKDLGLKGTTDSDIKRMISSDTIKDVSPLHLVYQQIESEKWDGTDYIQNFVDALNLKGNSTTNFNGNLQNVPHRVVLKLQEKGWILRNTIIWSKTNPKPSSSKSNLTPSYEFIFHLTKSTEYDYYRTLTPLNEKTKPSLPPRHRSVNGNYSDSVSPYLPNINGKNMGDYWNEDLVRTSVANQKLDIEGEHPAPFPEQIVTLPILQTSKEFELVLDPFMGSGTTGRACDKLGRSFVGYDLKGH